MYLYVKSLTNIDDTTDSCLITLTVMLKVQPFDFGYDHMS